MEFYKDNLDTLLLIEVCCSDFSMSQISCLSHANALQCHFVLNNVFIYNVCDTWELLMKKCASSRSVILGGFFQAWLS
jgi:hypothetical protein